MLPKSEEHVSQRFQRLRSCLPLQVWVLCRCIKKESYSFIRLTARNRFLIDLQALATGVRDVLVVKHCK